jgi:membrane-bound lytic murein transglycosylase D
MKLRNLIYILLLLINIPVVAQVVPQKKDTIYEVIQLENNLDSLIHQWYNDQATNVDFKYLKSANKNPDIPVLSDAEYKARLKKINNLIELPYNNIVRGFIEMYTVKKRKQVEIMLGLSEYYFPIFEEILDAKKMPTGLKYLPVIESALNPKAVSPMGASGLWQFMYRTGKMYDLEVTPYIDYRSDPVKASYAAAAFLKDLYDMFHDWNLVLAAYNCGPGNVNKAIKRAGGKKNYWDIYNYLPKETRGYVPAFIAATYAMTYYKEHNLSPIRVQIPLAVDTIMVDKEIHFQQIADVLEMDIKLIRNLNPQYRIDIIPALSKSFPLKLPFDKAMKYIELKDSIFNHKRGDFFMIETPENAGTSTAKPDLLSNTSTEKIPIRYTVKANDNLQLIAGWYNVTVAQLKSWNRLKKTSLLKGQQLTIYVPRNKMVYYKKINSMTLAEKKKLSFAKSEASIQGQPNETNIAKEQTSTTNETQVKTEETTKPAVKTDDFIYHIVKPGETLFKISQKYSVKYQDIMEINNIINANSLLKGQKLKIRKNS